VTMLTERDVSEIRRLQAELRELQRTIQVGDARRVSPSEPQPDPQMQFRINRHVGAVEAKTETSAGLQIPEVELGLKHLLSKRIVAHDAADRRSRPYDMLRTQVLRSMNQSKWRILGVTSPTPGCGKTTTAVNLAWSMARQPDHSVLLVDMDLQKGQVAKSLGLTGVQGGVLGFLQGRAAWQSTAVTVRAGNQRIMVLPTDTTEESSELMGSAAMSSLLHDIRKSNRSHTVILDMPPILSGDDAIAILPQIDCVLLVVAVGQSKMSEIEECNRHVHLTHLLSVVVNKAFV
jgi:protein-tyrosine kinase